MFSFFSSARKRIPCVKSVLAALALVLVSGFVVSCSNPAGSDDGGFSVPAEIAGFWQTEHSDVMSYWYTPSIGGFYADGFFIDRQTNTFFYYQDSTLETYWSGTIVAFVPEEGAEPSRLIIKISKVTGYWYTEPEAGKYLAVAYKNLAGEIVTSAQAYSAAIDAKNTGVDTIAGAISEYTAAKGYFDYLGTYDKRFFAAPSTLDGVQGNWLMNDVDGYYITIRGTTFTEFMDDYEEGDIGVYDPDDMWDMLASIGLIVDCTDTSQASGIFYVQVLGSDMGFSNFKYIAVAWKNKSANSIEFATGNNENATLAGIKSAYGNVSAFPNGSFYTYGK